MLHSHRYPVCYTGEILQQPGIVGRQDADSAAATPVFQTVDVKRIRAAWMRLISLVLDTANNLPLYRFSSDVFVSQNSSPLFSVDTRRGALPRASSPSLFLYLRLFNALRKMMEIIRIMMIFFWSRRIIFFRTWQQEHNVPFLRIIFYNTDILYNSISPW